MNRSRHGDSRRAGIAKKNRIFHPYPRVLAGFLRPPLSREAGPANERDTLTTYSVRGRTETLIEKPL